MSQQAAIPENTATPTYNHTIGARGDCYFVCQDKIIGKGSVHAIAGGIASITANAGLLFSSLAQLNRVVHGNLKFRTTTGEFIDAQFGREPDTHKVMDFLRTVSVVRCFDFHAGAEGVAHFSKVPGFGQPQPDTERNALYVGASLVDPELLEPNVPEVQLKLAEEALSLIANMVNWDTLSARDMAHHASAVLNRIQALRRED